MKTMREDPKVVPTVESWFPKWDAVIVPGSRKKGEICTELEHPKVEFRKDAIVR